MIVACGKQATMSEYQYYEFQAIDRPLTDKEESYIASLSSRVDLTPNRAIFTYSYSDFRGDPLKVLEKYFDAMLYMANWGTTQLAFRLPRSIIDPDRIAPYLVKHMISINVTKEHVLLDIDFNDEEGGDWIEGSGWLASLAQLRQDILRGDFRVLYLAWLKAVSSEEDGEEILEPPVPAGLQSLSPPLKKFVELFEVDEDLIDVASEFSSQTEESSEEDIEQMMGRLSESEKNDFLVRLVRGESNLDIQLTRRLHQISASESKADEESAIGRRSVAELLAASQEKARLRKEAERQKAERARIKRLTELRGREPQLWDEIFALIEKKLPKTYDEAVNLLKDAQEMSEHFGQTDEFQTRINSIYKQYSKRPGLLDRLRRAGLLDNSV